MGFEQSMTTSSGLTCADAYFKVGRVEDYDAVGRRCSFKLEAWKDKAARDATDPVQKKLRDVPTTLRFFVTGEDFDTYFGDDVLAGNGVSLLSQCYGYARAHADYTDATDLDPDE